MEESKTNGSEVEPKSPEELQLDAARLKYAEAYKAFLAERKADRKGFQRLANTKEYVLGATIEDEDTPDELKQLELEYNRAAVACGQSMFEDKKKKLKDDSTLSFEQKDSELRRFLQKDIFTKFVVEEQEELKKLQAGNDSQREKNITRKSLEWYLKLDWKKRLLVSFVLSGAFALATTPGAAVAAGGTAAWWGIKAIRTGSGMGALKGYDLLFTDTSAEERAIAEEELAEDFSDGVIPTFQETRRRYSQILEKEKKSKRNRLIKKAVFGIAVGGATSIGVGHLVENLADNIPSTHAEEVNLPKTTPTPETPPTQGTTPAPIDSLNLKTPATTDTPPVIEDVPVNTFHEVSTSFENGEGGIQGVLDLQKQIRDQYPDISKAPQSVQDFMNTDATKKAIELGFYDPNNINESALIQEGSILKFDEHGNLLFGKPDASGNIPELNKSQFEMRDTDKPVATPEPTPPSATPEPITPARPTAEELKAILEAKYSKNTPLFNNDERPSYDKNIGTVTSPKIQEVSPAQIPNAETARILQSHPEFAINNPYVLSTQQLVETYNVHSQNIRYLLPKDTAESWHNIGRLEAKNLLVGTKIGGLEDTMNPIVSYAQRLQAESGLRPQGGLLVREETFEHYEARALQRIASEGNLEKMRLHTPVPKSPTFNHIQQILQPEIKSTPGIEEPKSLNFHETQEILEPEIKPETGIHAPIWMGDGDVMIQKSVHYPLFGSTKVHFSYDESRNPINMSFSEEMVSVSGRELSSDNFTREIIKWAQEHGRDQQFAVNTTVAHFKTLYGYLAAYDDLKGSTITTNEAQFLKNTIESEIKFLNSYGDIIDFSKLPPEFQIKK